jgi:uncharacterized protein YdaU (DUF1376 family)
MSGIPYMPFFPEPYLVDTATLSLELQGAYFRLLCYMWIKGGKLPDNDKKLAALLGMHQNKWTKLRTDLGEYLLPLEGGYLSQKRLQAEYQRVMSRRSKLVENGKKGGRPKSDVNAAENHEIDKANGLASGLASGSPDGYDLLSGGESKSIANAPPDGSEMLKQNGDIPHPHQELKDKTDDDGAPPDPVDNFEAGSLYYTTLETLFTRNNLPLPIDIYLIPAWVREGADFQRDILPTIEKIVERIVRRGISPPKSFAYFQDSIKKAIMKRKAGEHG